MERNHVILDLTDYERLSATSKEFDKRVADIAADVDKRVKDKIKELEEGKLIKVLYTDSETLGNLADVANTKHGWYVTEDDKNTYVHATKETFNGMEKCVKRANKTAWFATAYAILLTIWYGLRVFGVL